MKKCIIVATLVLLSSVAMADNLENVSVNLDSALTVETVSEQSDTSTEDAIQLKVDNKVYIYTGGWSQHLTPYEEVGTGYNDYNEKHSLLGVEYKGYFAAYYKNSFYKDSIALAKNVYHRSYGDFDTSLYVGAVYGYASCIGEKKPVNGDAKVCAMIVPAITYTKYEVQPSILVLGNAVALSIRWEI